MEQELLLLWIALGTYVVAGCLALLSIPLRAQFDRTILFFMFVGLVPHTLSLGMRWLRLGHGPFVTLFEILSSNLWSMILIFALVYWRIPVIRSLAAVVLPLLFLMMGWLLLPGPGDSRLPPTFDTIWLYLHVGFGKVFLAFALLATGLGGVVLIRRLPGGAAAFPRLPGEESLDELGYRFLAVGMIFDTLMLVTGAIWAQHAWGRYWGWDPLETWSLITWLLAILALHVRPTFHSPPPVNALLHGLVFLVGFLTFFGVPFLSRVAHQGVV